MLSVQEVIHFKKIILKFQQFFSSSSRERNGFLHFFSEPL